VTNDAKEYGMKAMEKTIEGMKRIQHTVEKSSQVVNKLASGLKKSGRSWL
jgi:methyl-accepting chemotaxis protein